MTLPSRLLSGLLALVLLLTASVAATARHAPGGEIVTICAGGVAQDVVIGPDGAPIAPVPHCPDCVLDTVALPVPPSELGTAAGLQANRSLPTPRQLALSFFDPVPGARAPPAWL